MYRAARTALFRMDAETAHALTLSGLACARPVAQAVYGRAVAPDPREVLGLRFPNPVGLAAGLDKDGACIDGLAALGFGFLEIGTVTPRPQPGNPKPRMFRLPRERAIINRLGFNNHGVDHLLQRLQASRYANNKNAILGINIGKNFDTPLAQAHEDYLTCLRKVYRWASYITINISSPNTEGLRGLQDTDPLNHLLGLLKVEQARLAEEHGKYVPMALKVAPDLSEAALRDIAEIVIRHKFDAVIATNTTIGRAGVDGSPSAQEQGGLSGAPLTRLSNAAIRTLAQTLDGAVPIVGVGGIMCGADAQAKIAAGAELVQVYSGLIYRGPGLVEECVRALTRAS